MQNGPFEPIYAKSLTGSLLDLYPNIIGVGLEIH